MVSKVYEPDLERNFGVLKEVIFGVGYDIRDGVPHQKDMEAALVFLSCKLNWHAHIVGKKGGKRVIRAA